MILASGVKDHGSDNKQVQTIQRIVASILQPSAGQGEFVALGELVSMFPEHLRGLDTQEDASEFLMHVLDALDGCDWDIRPSEILTLELQQVLTCSCGSHRTSFVKESFISLPVSNDHGSDISSVQGMISRFCMQETMDEPSSCPSCQQSMYFQKQLLFSKIGPVLILNIKCFDNQRNKIFPSIDLNLALSIDLAEQGTLDFTLTAVIYHKGKNLKRGHYIVRCLQAGCWIEADDASVKPVDGPKLSEKLSVPYILIYTHNSLLAKNGALRSALCSLRSGFEYLPLQLPEIR